MAVDMFLKLDGIPGESKDQKKVGEIDILAWSWGMSQSGTMHMSGGGGAGKASFQDISCTAYYEKSTPELMTACSTGKHIASGVLTVRKAGTEQLEFIVYKLTDILVSSVSTGLSGGEDRPTVNFSLNFAKIETEYFEQKKDGSLEAAKRFGYNIEENVKV